MLAAGGANAGLYYICTPNNPTGTLTPKEDVEWLVENKPKGSIVMVDEAYMHIAGAPFHSDLVAKDKDVVILRPFRRFTEWRGCAQVRRWGVPTCSRRLPVSAVGSCRLPGMAAATASLQQKNLVPERRKAIGAIREDTFGFLERHHFSYVPSVSNCFMVDVKRPGMEAVLAMRREKVYVGRVWPIMPNHVRVTVGTAEEMKKFQTAFLKVMA